MAEKREWKGITINEAMFQGKLLEDPVIVPTAGGNKCAFMKLRTFVNELGANGQWTEAPSFIPLVVMDPRKVDVVEKYVKAQRELFVRSYFKTWPDGNGNQQHGFVVTQMKLGSKGFNPNKEQPQSPPMPE